MYSNLFKIIGDSCDQVEILSSIFENMPIAVFLKDVNDSFKVVMWNRESERIFGITRSEIVGMTAHDFWPKEEADLYLEADQKVARSGVAVTIDHEPSHAKERGTRHLRTRKIPIRKSESSSVRFLLCLCEDITQEVLANEEQSRLSRLLNEAQATAKLGSWDLDLKNGSLVWTSELYRIFEVPEPQPSADLLKIFQDRVHPDDFNDFNRKIFSSKKTGLSFDQDYRIQMTDGRTKHLQVIGQVQIDSTGQALRVTGTTQDVTERKLTESQLLQSSKLASLGEMAAGVAHEINNPLAIIHGTVESLLRKTDKESPQILNLNTIHRATQRISKIVGGLVKFSGDSARSERAQYSLFELLNEVVFLATTKSKTCQTRVELVCEQDAKIFCNVIEIEQVFLNLINNAIDAVKNEASRWVKVSIDQKDQRALVCVADSGRGIPEANRNRIFDPFFSTKQVGEGCGLGLSISRGILRDHNASIRLVEAAQHTCFELSFELADGCDSQVTLNVESF